MGKPTSRKSVRVKIGEQSKVSDARYAMTPQRHPDPGVISAVDLPLDLNGQA